MTAWIFLIALVLVLLMAWNYLNRARHARAKIGPDGTNVREPETFVVHHEGKGQGLDIANTALKERTEAISRELPSGADQVRAPIPGRDATRLEQPPSDFSKYGDLKVAPGAEAKEKVLEEGPPGSRPQTPEEPGSPYAKGRRVTDNHRDVEFAADLLPAAFPGAETRANRAMASSPSTTGQEPGYGLGRTQPGGTDGEGGYGSPTAANPVTEADDPSPASLASQPANLARQREESLFFEGDYGDFQAETPFPPRRGRAGRGAARGAEVGALPGVEIAGEVGLGLGADDAGPGLGLGADDAGLGLVPGADDAGLGLGLDQEAAGELGLYPEEAQLWAPIPTRAGADELIALARNPRSLYVYWDLSGPGEERLRQMLGAEYERTRPCLRVYDLTDPSRSFHIDLGPEHDHWFINEGIEPGHRYMVSYERRTDDGQSFMLTRSGPVYTPREGQGAPNALEALFGAPGRATSPWR